jgi:hypothetical protein
MQSSRSAWRLALASAALCTALLLSGCSCGGKDPAFIGTFRMGERVQVGPLIYTVLDSEWKTALDSGRVPQHRFLVIRLSMTNTGAEQASVPGLEIIAENGAKHQEVTENVEGVRDWLGLMRMVAPGATEQGTILFDAPMAAYKLVLPEGGEIATERHAHVEVPVQLH